MVPIIDVIDDKTLEYYHGNGNYFQVFKDKAYLVNSNQLDRNENQIGNNDVIDKNIPKVGGFTWSGHFTWVDIPPSELARRGSPIAPTRLICYCWCCWVFVVLTLWAHPHPRPHLGLQRWLGGCSPLHEILSGLLAPMIRRWTCGEVRWWWLPPNK